MSGVSYKRRRKFLSFMVILIVFLASAAYGNPDMTTQQMTNGQRAFFIDNPGLHVEWNANEGIPYSIRGLSKVVSGDRVKAITDYLHEIRAVFKITDAASEMKLKKIEKDELGFEHYRFHQVYQGIRIINGEMIVQINARSQISQINGHYFPGAAIPTIPAKSGRDVMADALQEFASKSNFRIEKEPELVIYPHGLSAYRLAYHYVLYYNDGAGDVGRWVFYADAHTGEILNRYNNIQYFKAGEETPEGYKGTYPAPNLLPSIKQSPPINIPSSTIAAPTTNGSNRNVTGVILQGEGGNNVTVPGWYESTNDSYYLYNKDLWWYVYNASTSSSYVDANTYAYRTSSSDWGATDPTEMSAAQNIKIVQDYYKTVHSRNSFDNASSYARVNVHYGTNYVNAFWDGTSLTIGDGDGVSANSLAVLDIMGHEFSHAWTNYTSNLTYQGESGALNESFSDIMGATIEFYAQQDGRSSYPGKQAGKADWLLGEDCWLSSTALRDMRNPSNASTVSGYQPSRYHGQYWYDGASDHNGVHQNSGPHNFFYYLLSEGGSGINDGLSYSVTGIGVNNARLVAYRTNTYKLTASSGYAAARAAWISAASDLNAAWVDSVKAAWDAIGIIDVPATVTESFEGSSLPSGWTTGGSTNWSVVSDTAKHGSKSVRSGVIQDTQSTWLQTIIALPTAGNLSFFVKVSSEMGYDKLEFYVDGVRKTTWSGEVPWTSFVINLGAGSHTIKWQYVKDESASSGSDAAWIDALTYSSGGTSPCTYSISPTSANVTPSGGTGTVNMTAASGCSWTAVSGASWVTVTSGSSGSGNGTVGYSVAANQGSSSRSGAISIGDKTFTITQNGGQMSIATAVDNSSFNWTTGGDANWYPQTISFYYDNAAVQSGAIDNNKQTYLQTTVTGPGTVSFYWKVSSEVNFDFLKFYIDGSLKNSISGEVNWQKQTYPVSSGSHTLKWQYIKDAASRVASDAGWLDKFVYCAGDLCCSSPTSVATSSVGSSNTIKITDMSGALPVGGSAITVSAWDVYGNALAEAGSASPLMLFSRKTTTILGSDLAARFNGTPMAYEFAICSSQFVITNVKSRADGTLNIPVVYTKGVSTYVSNSIGPRNTIKITDMSGSVPAGGAAIIVHAWDASGNALTESGGATALRLYSHGTTPITGPELAARFPTGSPMTYDFTIGSPKVVVTNVKSSADGYINIPTVYINGVTNFVSNSTGPRNTLKISDLSGSLPTDGGVVTVSAWNADGSAIPQSGAATPLKLYSRGTTTITGSELAARFPTGLPMTYEFVIGSSKVVITNIKSSTDGTINIPTVYTSGITNFAANYVSPRTTIRITDMSGALIARAAITVAAWNASGNSIPQSATAAPFKFNNRGTTTITGSELAVRFPDGSPAVYEFSVDSSKVIVTNLTSTTDGTIDIPSIYTSGLDGGI